MENQTQEQELMEAPVTGNSLLVNEASLNEKFVESAAKQIELRARLLQTALKALKPHDIQDFDGKPYIEGEGAARIMAVIRGFRVEEAKFTIDNIHPHYFIECLIPIEFMGAKTVAIGDCSTADPFFCGKDGNAGQYRRHLDRTGSEAMAGRLLLGDAKKKARENAISRGVSELLGLKGLSWEDLEKLGFSRNGAGSNVSFKKGSQGGEIKTISILEALALPDGSKFNVKGFVSESVERSVTAKGESKKVSKYTVTDNKNRIEIQVWESRIDFADKEVFFGEVIVGSYLGSKQYTAKEISAVEKESSNGNA
jgi:hypothetical protein